MKTANLLLAGWFVACGYAHSLSQPAASYERILSEPWVARAADGVMRSSKVAGASEAYLPIVFASSHSPGLLMLKSGGLLCFWASGTWEGESGFGIVVARLPSKSHQWSAVTVVARKEGESYQNPAAFEAPDGAIHLFHTAQAAGSGQETSRILETISHDGGATWTQSATVVATPGAYSGHVPIVAENGAWLLPVSFQVGAGSTAKSSAAVMRSADKGKSWVRTDIPGSEGLVQPSVAIGKHGLIVFLRSQASDFIYRSSSVDGRVWATAVATKLPNNNASVEGYRLHNGDLVMAFDNSSVDHTAKTPAGGLRKPLSIALSKDDGVTWQFVRDIETGRDGFGEAEQKPKIPGREEYSFPSIVQARDGTIFVAFNYRRQTIKVVSFRESWIRHGGSTGVYRGAAAR